jgi:cystathionine beta-synthase
MYNDYWMFDQGLLDRRQEGDLTDLITRRFADGGTVTVAADDSLLMVYRRMKLYEVSQLPVVEAGRVVGIIDESDLLLAVAGSTDAFEQRVSAAMTAKIETIRPNAPITELLPIFAHDRVALVEEDGQFHGIITRIDLLNHLRQKLP